MNRVNMRLSHIVRQHAEDGAALHVARQTLLRAGDVRLEGIARLDQRIAAHLDGVSVAESDTSPITPEELFENLGVGEAFVSAVRALDRNDFNGVDSLVETAEADTTLRPGLLAAFAWVSRYRLRGVVVDLLQSHNPWLRTVGIAACSMHRVDPDIARRVSDQEPHVRARAMRCAGELGKRELVSLCARSIDGGDPDSQFWAAWSAVLLGDRERGLAWLSDAVPSSSPHHACALQLVLQTSEIAHGHAAVQAHAADSSIRLRIRGAAYIGDPRYVGWLIGQMGDDKYSRLAGESFSMVTGLDLWQPPFFRPRPEGFESGPTEDPEDENVEMDEDDGLPWPDQAQVQAWWNEHGARFTTGVRHFIGAPPSRAHCIEVLKNGYQRQRIAAAYHLCLLNPGTPLFEWRAPAWRQQRELAQMS
jgi:uncharacterized protein (TIGR02270 family)